MRRGKAASVCTLALLLLSLSSLAEVGADETRSPSPRNLQAEEMESESMDRSVSRREKNRLFYEKSPYLLQHADNPVNWYPWSEAAFDRARKEDKPVFLSIGYSTCHWCHVMAKESFEDEEVADLINETFVSIKVDREERPDIDNVYMTVCQMMTGSGGWPLTIFMTPDKKPFYAATYIPKENAFGGMGMKDLIPRIGKLWKTRRGELLDSAERIVSTLEQESESAVEERLDQSASELAYEELARRFDDRHGGFSGPPKFPTPHNLLYLLRYWRRTGEKEALSMVEKTLQEMRKGGIYDQLGFGFHRYSTDGHWLVPHFEKMLYDQAMLAMAYAEAYQATRKSEYEQTAREILDYVLSEMTAEEGGFLSALDADSEGEEGKYYLWSEREMTQFLSAGEMDLARGAFNIRPEGNFHDESTGHTTGQNILHMTQSIEDHARTLKVPREELAERLESVRKKLLSIRRNRVPPHTDDKILTDWNGLMIAALAKGSQAFGDERYARAARKAMDFILEKMRGSDGRLLHRYRDGEAAITPIVDDYAFTIWALVELYEATLEVRYLENAIEFEETMRAHFWDEDGGGFYFTADDAESLLTRQKKIYDGAIPSANSVAMLNLLRLGRMVARPELEERADRLARAFSHQVKASPSAFTMFMSALEFTLEAGAEVVVVGDSQTEETAEMLRALQGSFIPHVVFILRAEEEETPAIDDLTDFTSYQTSLEGRSTAYVCRNYQCQSPTTSIEEMLEQIDRRE